MVGCVCSLNPPGQCTARGQEWSDTPLALSLNSTQVGFEPITSSPIQHLSAGSRHEYCLHFWCSCSVWYLWFRECKKLCALKEQTEHPKVYYWYNWTRQISIVYTCYYVSIVQKHKKKHCNCGEMAAMYDCLYVCCISLYMYMCVFTAFKANVCVPLCSTKAIDESALNKK